jgi:hypothetical protein
MILGSITPIVVRTWWAKLPADKPTVRARSYALLGPALDRLGNAWVRRTSH